MRQGTATIHTALLLSSLLAIPFPAAGCGDDEAGGTDAVCTTYCTRVHDCAGQPYDPCIIQCTGMVDSNPATCRDSFTAFNTCAEPVSCDDLNQGVCNAEVNAIINDCPYVP